MASDHLTSHILLRDGLHQLDILPEGLQLADHSTSNSGSLRTCSSCPLSPGRPGLLHGIGPDVAGCMRSAFSVSEVHNRVCKKDRGGRSLCRACWRICH